MTDIAPMEVDSGAGRDKGKGKVNGATVGVDANLAKNAMWVEKYRPSSVDDLISHQDIISTLTKFVDENRVPHLLFYGPAGTGKTSTILALARRMYGAAYSSNVLELNASDDRGIDVVRNVIKDFASTATISFTAPTTNSMPKLVVLDECDAMTSTAQMALRRVIERYAKTTRFCLICNYVSKIIPALQSRCTRFRFAPLSNDQISSRLRAVAVSEQLDLPDEGLEAVVSLSGGDMRRSLNILQSTAMAFPTLSMEAVYSTTGNPLPSDVRNMFSVLTEQPIDAALEFVNGLKEEKGLALADLISAIHPHLRKLGLPVAIKAWLYKELADLEDRMSAATNEKLQTAAFVAVFIQLRARVAEAMAAASQQSQ